MNNLDNILGLLTLIVGVPLNLYIVVRLRRLSKEQPTFQVLGERLLTAGVVLVVVVVFGLVFVNNDAIPPPLPLDWTKIITRSAILALAILPAVRWLLLYRDGS